MSVSELPYLNRAERRKLQTRERLVDAARQMLFSRGYQNLSIKAITDCADLGYGTFYLYFTDKDDIVWAVIFEMAELWRHEVDSRLEPMRFPMREYLSWIAIFKYAESRREGFIEMFGTGGSAKLAQYYQNYLAQLHIDNMQTGFYSANNDVPAPFLAQMMAGAMMRLLVWWLENPNDYTAVEMAQMMYQTMFREAVQEDAPHDFWEGTI
jgi:AcrR family transcriptional regulator